MRKKIKLKTNHNPSEYINPDTGETLPSELSSGKNCKIQLTKEEDSDYYVIDSERYIIIDSKALTKVTAMLKQAELAKVLKLADKVKTPFNIIYDDKEPYTPEKLSEFLEFDLHNFYTLVRKLVKKGILAYVVCAPSGYLKKVYMLNPTLARKGKRFHNYTLDIFPDLGK
jgi:hypothetical protein